MDRVVYGIYRLAVALLAALPLEVDFLLGQALGTLGYYVALPYRRLVLRNLQIAFGAEKSANELRRIARRHFSTLGANVLSGVKLGTMRPAEVSARVIREDDEVLRRFVAEGTGVIWVLSHIGNWEIFPQLGPHYFPGTPMATVFQRLGNRFINEHVKKTRAAMGVLLLDRKEGFAKPIQFLRAGNHLGILVDQHAGDGGVWTPFFGRLASTSPLAATLAIRTRSALVPVAIYSHGVARWRYVVSEPILRDTNDAHLLTLRINAALEQQIRASPADWFWVHNRWKTPSPKFLLGTYKRGLHLPSSGGSSPLKPFNIVIRSSNWLGDAIISVPAVRAIKRGRPDAQVTVLTPAKLADFWKIVPEVDAILSIEPQQTVLGVAARLRETPYDVAVIFPNSIRSALEPYLGGVPRRVGYRSKWRSSLLSQVVREDDKPHPPRHQVHHYLALAESIGATIDEVTPAESPAPLPAPGEKVTIGLCPGADYGPAKRWLPDRFAEVARLVAQRRSCEWIMFGTANDAGVGTEIEALLEGKCTNLIGRTSLAELIGTLRSCHVLVTNDTGTMHLAAFLQVPVVAIFGSTEPALTGPLGPRSRVLRHQVECSPCFLRKCPIDFRCMKAVHVDEVVEAVIRLLDH